jgi:hypothetical protein
VPGWPDFARLSVLIEHFTIATAALSAGRRKGGLMAEAAAKYNQGPDSSSESALAGHVRAGQDPGTIFLAWELHHTRTMEVAMRESWRTYICFVLAATIFILCQALSGGVPGNPADGISPDPGDRTYRDALRDETSG